MSETSSPRRVLHLVVEGPAESARAEVVSSPGDEVFVLTEANAAEALEKIFTADTVAVWGVV